MFYSLTFDELNALNETIKSEPYETYFGDMDLDEEEKERRIELAKKLENEFVGVLAFLFSMQQFGSVNWDEVRILFENAYIAALSGSIILNQEIRKYVSDFSSYVTDSTRNHEADPYYYTIDRAMFMAENEANTSFNYRNYYDAISSGKKNKRWMDMKDKRERATHIKVGGTSKKIEEFFLVGDSLMLFPKDSAHGASSSEIVNCRCWIESY